jgi:hypothetical protein
MTATTDPTQWTSPDLAAATLDLEAARQDLAKAEQAYAALADRADYDADVERARWRPVIAAARPALRSAHERVQRLVDLAAAVNQLWPRHRAREADLRARVAGLLASSDVPDRAAVLALWADSRQTETLRRALFAVTGWPEVATSYDATRALEAGWAAQQAARARVFRFLMPGPHRPTPEPDADAALAAKLTQLMAATTTTPERADPAAMVPTGARVEDS